MIQKKIKANTLLPLQYFIGHVTKLLFLTAFFCTHFTYKL